MRRPHLLKTTRIGATALIVAAVSLPTQRCLSQQLGQRADAPDKASEGASFLRNAVQLTFADQFYKAGESYFSPDGKRIVFQGVETPELGQSPASFYGMYVADVLRDGSGHITGLSNIRRISPTGSANTCGWFDPNDPNVVYFATTRTPPENQDAPGWVPSSGRYQWMFPREMHIVKTNISTIQENPDKNTLEHVVGNDEFYQAEGAISPDGRHLVYTSLESNEGDLFVLDLQTGTKSRIVAARGYDGGPFFSPDGQRICYRSDRDNNSLLQLFVADLAFNDYGEIVGIEREYQLTDNGFVNWCPFWHPDGQHLVFATSRHSHFNYEVYMVDADPGNLEGSTGTIKYGTNHRRITSADRADVLPAFSPNGRHMIWTSQRGEDGESQLWAADFVLRPVNPGTRQPAFQRDASESATTGDGEGPVKGFMHVVDPETETIFVYDPKTHEVSIYDPVTHQLTPVTDKKTLERVMELFKSREE